jgi:hypothetical protein
MLERGLWRLDRLAAIGMEMAEAVHRQAARQAEAEGPQPAGAKPSRTQASLSQAHARIGRSVRLTVMLQAKLIGELRALDDPQSILAHPRPEAERKLRVLRIVKHAARDEHAEGEAVERLVREAAERLDREDVCADLMSKPTGEIITFICRELGLDPDWPSLAQDAWDEAERAGEGPEIKPPPKPRSYTVEWLEPSGPPAPPRAGSP